MKVLSVVTAFLLCMCTSPQNAVHASREDSWSITMDYSRVFFMDRLWFFRRAARRWAQVIVGDMPDRVGPSTVKTECGDYPKSIDDLYICASYQNIDGAGGFIAAAGATLARSDEQWQPYAGVMVFDRKDIIWLRRHRNFRNLVLREMGHVIGLSSAIWQRSGVAGSVESDPPCPYYGTRATEEWQAISGCDTAVPTETDFPNNRYAQCNHWSSSCMTGEIMTADSHTLRYAALSRITVGALADMNFTVDYNAADPYTKEDLNPQCVCEDRNLRQPRATETPSMSEQALREATLIGESLMEEMSVDSTDSVQAGVDVWYEENGTIFNILVSRQM